MYNCMLNWVCGLIISEIKFCKLTCLYKQIDFFAFVHIFDIKINY